MYDILKLDLDYSKPETVQCSQNKPLKFVENYENLFITDKNETLEKKEVLEKSFQIQNYNNDLAFGCQSISQDFDFESNKNVKEIAKLLEANQTLTLQREMYKKNSEALEEELDRMVKNF